MTWSSPFCVLLAYTHEFWTQQSARNRWALAINGYMCSYLLQSKLNEKWKQKGAWAPIWEEVAHFTSWTRFLYLNLTVFVFNMLCLCTILRHRLGVLNSFSVSLTMPCPVPVWLQHFLILVNMWQEHVSRGTSKHTSPLGKLFDSLWGWLDLWTIQRWSPGN